MRLLVNRGFWDLNFDVAFVFIRYVAYTALLSLAFPGLSRGSGRCSGAPHPTARRGDEMDLVGGRKLKKEKSVVP